MKHLRKKYYFQRADTHLLSFPKCGRTWLRLMLHGLITEHWGIPGRDSLQLHKLASRRLGIPAILSSHDFQVVRNGERVEEIDRDKTRFRGRRVLLLVRDPRDVVVSFYYHKTWREQSWTGSKSEFIRESFDGLPTIIEYYNIWAANRHLPSDFAVFRYEDLVNDTVAQMHRIARFVGLEGIPEANLATVAQRYEFSNMRAMEARGGLGQGRHKRPGDAENPNSYKTRSGRVGGYCDELSEEDCAFVDTYVHDHLDPFFASYRR